MRPAESGAHGAARHHDWTLGLGLLVVGVVYVVSLPHVLGGSDEGIYLYEAKRLLDGGVFYRDIFDLITPGAHYLMAAVFAVFGATMETARLADAVIHGLVVLGTYATCRMLAVRRVLAAAAALTQLAVFQPAWPVASPHWLATLLGLLIIPALLGRPRGLLGLVAGVLAGLLICVQQQKGVAMTAGAAAFLLTERVLPSPTRGTTHPWRIPAFGAGIVLVVVPLGILLVLSAGVRPVVQALVLHPLLNYPRLNRTSWGSVGPFPWYARYTFPTALAAAPIVLSAIAAVRAGLQLVRREDGERLRRSVLLGLMAFASIASILYYPDYVHLSFIGAVFAIVAADLAEVALGALPSRSRFARWMVTLVPVVLLAATGAQLTRVMIGSWRDFPFSHLTPFGRMEFHEQHEIDVVERMRTVIDRSASRELFVYPFGAGFYLLTGTVNPTPFQFLLPAYSRPDQIDLTLTILEERQVPYVLVVSPMTPSDPVLRYVSSHFEQVEDQHGKLPLFRRVHGAGE